MFNVHIGAHGITFSAFGAVDGCHRLLGGKKAGWQTLSRPSAAEGGGRRHAFTGSATQPYSATEGGRLATSMLLLRHLRGSPHCRAETSTPPGMAGCRLAVRADPPGSSASSGRYRL